MKKLTPVVQFDITAERFRLSVKIFEKLGQMRKYLATSRPDMDHSEDWAFTDEKRGEMIFCLYTMTDRCVSHECWHATALWASHRLPSTKELAGCLQWGHAAHEEAAETCGNFAGQIWHKFTKAGFHRKECHGFKKGKKK